MGDTSQRWWRCVEDQSKLVPYYDPAERVGHTVSSRDPVRPTRDPWREGLLRSEFPGLYDE
jgi:hypothetical protein